MSAARNKAILWGLVVSTWLGLLGGGSYLVWHYKMAPGAVGAVKDSWPEPSSLQRHPSLPTLLVFAHPRCPCTRATLAELERLKGRIGSRVHATVVVALPKGVEAGWEKADLFTVVKAMAGVEVVMDQGGREAELFGAMTSGHTFLFSSGGALLFSGGLTSARGHEGPAVAQEEIVDAVSRDAGLVVREKVFGCGFRSPADHYGHHHMNMEHHDE